MFGECGSDVVLMDEIVSWMKSGSIVGGDEDGGNGVGGIGLDDAALVQDLGRVRLPICRNTFILDGWNTVVDILLELHQDNLSQTTSLKP